MHSNVTKSGTQKRIHIENCEWSRRLIKCLNLTIKTFNNQKSTVLIGPNGLFILAFSPILFFFFSFELIHCHRNKFESIIKWICYGRISIGYRFNLFHYYYLIIKEEKEKRKNTHRFVVFHGIPDEEAWRFLFLFFFCYFFFKFLLVYQLIINIMFSFFGTMKYWTVIGNYRLESTTLKRIEISIFNE